MIIKFKNGSTIKTVEPKGEVKRSQPKEFQIEGISEYIQYLKRHPSAYAEFHGIKLHWWQKVYIDVISLLYSPKYKVEKRYNELMQKYKLK